MLNVLKRMEKESEFISHTFQNIAYHLRQHFFGHLEQGGLHGTI